MQNRGDLEKKVGVIGKSLLNSFVRPRISIQIKFGYIWKGRSFGIDQRRVGRFQVGD
jgi:hypothetical protein